MKGIVQIVKTVITNILIALYQPFWYAAVASVLLCFLYLYAYHPVDTGNGLKSAFKTWIEEFKRSIFFRRLFLLSFFTIMILFQTLFNRNMWANPLSDVLGGWWIWDTVNGEKKLTTECFENLVLMLPFTFFLFLTFGFPSAYLPIVFLNIRREHLRNIPDIIRQPYVCNIRRFLYTDNCIAYR